MRHTHSTEAKDRLQVLPKRNKRHSLHFLPTLSGTDSWDGVWRAYLSHNPLYQLYTNDTPSVPIVSQSPVPITIACSKLRLFHCSEGEINLLGDAGSSKVHGLL